VSAAALDTLARVETPEGIAVELRAAGLMPRACAWLIDLLIRIGGLWVLSIPLTLFGEAGQGLMLLSLFLLTWGYTVLFEVLMDGQTPGKRVMALRVVLLNGAPVGWLQSLTRNLLRTVDMLPVCYGFGTVAVLADSRARRLGDLVAGTLVVHTELPSHAQIDNVPELPVPVSLTLNERQAIVAFAERAQQLTIERQRELAALVPKLTEGSGVAPVDALKGMARSVLGR
jgi:uncharacterized RDD family membrane protein YckC